ncbi:hypothetical protein LTR53_014616 [Teratosphaeriaceae sp. CCFEE 6253]|nr:hypothetical protein LTR53_014616 [Teratosphaeriaceae sp. CCFEE 6253]
MLLGSTLTLAALTSYVSAARLIVAVPSSPPLLPNPASLGASTHAVLVGPPGVRYDAPIRRDNTFAFPELAEASYLLTVKSRDYDFPALRVDVSKASDGSLEQTIQAWQTFRGNEWSNKGPQYGSGKGELRIQVQPSHQKDYYQSRGGFNLLGFFKSPMILMGLVSVVFIFGMPYIMENMDPETKQEFEDMQKKSPLTGSGGAASQLQNFDIASWLAGKSSDADGGGGKKR